MVDPDLIADTNMTLLSQKIASQIKEELTFPGMVRVTLLRESKFIDYAK